MVDRKRVLRDLGFLVGLVLVGGLLGWLLGGCTPTPTVIPPEQVVGETFRARELGPGYVADPQGMAIHDIDPERDLIYLGAFAYDAALSFGEGAKEYYRYGAQNQGTLFCTGHVQDPDVFEVTIPVPKVTKDYGALYKAQVVSRGDISAPVTSMQLRDLEIVWYGPAQRLHMVFAKHYQYTPTPCFASSRLTLANPETRGPWYVGEGVNPIETNEYLFTLPAWWAHKYANDYRICAGRHRDGQGPSGPTLYAFGDSAFVLHAPPTGAELPSVTLLRYEDLACFDGREGNCIVDHCPEDDYRGAAFIEDGPRRAFVFIQRKSAGRCWYGYPDGSVCPPICDCSDCGGERGYQAEGYQARMIFFRASDLAMVAQGHWPPWKPQPYAVLDLTPYMLNGDVNLCGVAYSPQTDIAGDPHSGWLFVTQQAGHETMSARHPVAHVWKVGR